MVLHTLNATAGSTAFIECLRLAAAEDCILLLGVGVYGAIAKSVAWEKLQSSEARVYLLEADAQAAGILSCSGDIEVLDYDGFVALSETCPRQIAWY